MVCSENQKHRHRCHWELLQVPLAVIEYHGCIRVWSGVLADTSHNAYLSLDEACMSI